MMRRMVRGGVATRTVHCDYCGAIPGCSCWTKNGQPTSSCHKARFSLWLALRPRA